jgi:hypothetical protein
MARVRSPRRGRVLARVLPKARGGLNDSQETSGYAIASLFIAIVWIFGLGSIVAIFLGRRALREIDESGDMGGRGIAIAGIVIGLAGLASAGLLVAFLAASGH